MTAVLRELIERLELERIEENIFRGQSQDLGWGRVFGGQVLGQALSAAEQTVPADRMVHSFHGYFLRPGDAAKPIVFTVDPIRDGSSFTTRRVVAVQDGRAIYTMAASFQVEEGGFDHQAAVMPDVPGPDELLSEKQLGERYLESLPEAVRAAVPLSMRERVLADRPIEIRPVAPLPPLDPPAIEPRRRVWFRANGELPDRRATHELVLAYASDFHLLGTALQPHAVSWLTPRLQIASLDHAMWFHRRFRFDDWLLYDLDSPSAQGGRGLAHGRWFTRDGVLVASTMQEGLIRDRR
jgi:acyl-CoA thioesterase II